MDQLIISIRSMPTQYFLILLAILCLLAIVALVIAFKNLKIARLIANTPRSKIRSAVQGYIELQGNAATLTESGIIAPLSGRRCCWYRYRVEKEITQRDQDGSTSTTWQEIDSGSSDGRLFLLKDETGECVIDPKRAKIKARTKKTWQDYSLANYNKGGVSGFFEDFFSFADQGKYQLTEQIIEEGETLYALGSFKTVSVLENPMEQMNQQKLKQHASTHKTKIAGMFERVLKRLQRDTNLSAKDWQEYTEDKDKKSFINYLHKHQQPYILSTYPEKKLIRKYYWISFFCLLGFFLVGFISGYIIFYRL